MPFLLTSRESLHNKSRIGPYFSPLLDQLSECGVLMESYTNNSSCSKCHRSFENALMLLFLGGRIEGFRNTESLFGISKNNEAGVLTEETAER
jgi:hypothetical protein